MGEGRQTGDDVLTDRPGPAETGPTSEELPFDHASKQPWGWPCVSTQRRCPRSTETSCRDNRAPNELGPVRLQPLPSRSSTSKIEIDY
jgi:hypothetical protein